MAVTQKLESYNTFVYWASVNIIEQADACKKAKLQEAV